MHKNNQLVRSNKIDSIRGIAIILVIIGHCIQMCSGETYRECGLYVNNSMYKLIYTFHMPLFMLVGGYLFGASVKRYSFNDLLIKLCKSYIAPIFCWTVVLCLIKSVLGIHFSILGTSFGDWWYLWAAFASSVLVLVVSKKLNDSIIIYLVIIVASMILPDIAFSVKMIKFVFPYFVCGYLYYSRDKKFVGKEIESFCLLLTLGLIFAVLYKKFDYYTYIYFADYGLIGAKLGFYDVLVNDFLRLSIGLIGSLIIILSVEMLSGINTIRHIVRAGVFLGRNTLGLYTISTLIITYVMTYFTDQFNEFRLGVLPIEVIVAICISVLINCGLKKVSVFNWLLLGGRKA